MVQASSVRIEDPFDAEPVLQAALRVALKTAPWNTSKASTASRNDVVKVADKACEDAGLRRGNAPRKALNGLLEILANCAWVNGDVKGHAKQRLLDAGMDEETAGELSGRIATNVVAAARSTNDSILWAADAEDCPLDDLLRLVFRRGLPLVGVSSRARKAAWQLLTPAGMGRLPRESLKSNVFTGGSGQTAIAAVIGTQLATLRGFDALLVTEDLDQMVAAFLANRIPSMRQTALPAFPEQDRRAIEARFAQIAEQLPALSPIVRQRAARVPIPWPRHASTTLEATIAEPVEAGSTARDPVEHQTFPSIFAPLDEELLELELKGPALAARANIWATNVPDLIQEARMVLWQSRDVDGRVRQGSWSRALQEQINAHFRGAHKEGQFFDETHIDGNQSPVDEADGVREPRPELVEEFLRLREYYDDLPGESHAVLLIRKMLADPSVYDDSAAFLVWHKQIAWWVYGEVDRLGWDVDRDGLVAEMLASLKASIRALLGPEGDLLDSASLTDSKGKTL
jgi:hypothetical protein